MTMRIMITAINIIVTVHRMRAPGMHWFRLPLFVWAMYGTSLIQVLGTPILAITIVVGTATALWSLRLPKIYAATVVLEFDPSPTRPLSGSEVHDIDQQNAVVWASREYFQTQQRVIVSERVSEGVTRELG